MRALTVLATALALVAQAAGAQSPPLFDSHVHLWKGEDSLRAYEEQLKEGRLQVAGIGAMWFGGPNQALAGQLEKADEIERELDTLGYRGLYRSADAANYARGDERVDFLYASRPIARRLRPVPQSCTHRSAICA